MLACPQTPRVFFSNTQTLVVEKKTRGVCGQAILLCYYRLSEIFDKCASQKFKQSTRTIVLLPLFMCFKYLNIIKTKTLLVKKVVS